MRAILPAGLVLAFLAAAGPARAAPFEIRSCDEVIVVLEDPVDPEGEVGPKAAEIACRVLRELAPRFGVTLGPEPLQLRIADDRRSFHEETGQFITTGAIYAWGKGIVTQPARQMRRLYRQGLLEGLIAHELTHYLVFRAAGPRCPKWLHEGLACHFEGRRLVPALRDTVFGEAEVQALERRWNSASVPHSVRVADYGLSHLLVERLIERVGLDVLLGSLSGMGNRSDPLKLPVAGSSLRGLMFGGGAAAAGSSQLEIGRHEDEALDADEPAQDKEPGVTRLPLKEMMEKARQKQGEKAPPPKKKRQ